MAQNHSRTFLLNYQKQRDKTQIIQVLIIPCNVLSNDDDMMYIQEHIIVDRMNVNLQEGSLTHWINVHLSSTTWNQMPYRLNVMIKDSQGIHLQSTHCTEKKAPYRTIFATKSKLLKRFRKNLRHVQNHCHDLGNFF
jgi:hypothetical protein